VRSVAYEGLLLAERRRLHGDVARAYEALGSADPHVLAHHYEASDEDAAAVAALARTAEAHLAVGDLATALEELRRAVARMRGADELGGQHRAVLLGRMGDVLVVRGELAAAAATFADAAITIQSGLIRAELLRRRALVDARRGQDDAALDALQEARDDVTMAELEGNESVEAIFTALASLAAAAARIHLGGERWDEASWEARQSLEMLSHLSPDFALEPVARRPVAEANEVLAAALLEGDDGTDAGEHADAARVAYDALKDLAGTLRADVLIARARAAEGSVLEARARLEAAADLARRLGDREGSALVDSALSDLAVAAV
jgi:hypothetical protein